MNQIIIQLPDAQMPNEIDATIQANDLDDAIIKLQELKSMKPRIDREVVERFKGIASLPAELGELEADWYQQ